MRSILIAALLLGSTSAHAFGLSDHKRIMLQAAKELEACLPGTFSSWDVTNLWVSDLEEDVNVVRKDLVFSHFYNPNKKLNMHRLTSEERITLLQFELVSMASARTRHGILYLEMIAQAAHHLQDMATPPHVVPVMHGPWDGFEGFAVKGEISSGLTCEQFLNPASGDLHDLLQSTALETLARVNSAQIEVTSGLTTSTERTKTVMNASAYWKESDNNDFGQYGVLGNNFGKSEFVVGENSYSVPASFYEDFKREQMNLAVRATLKALAWYLRITSPPAAPNP